MAPRPVPPRKNPLRDRQPIRAPPPFQPNAKSQKEQEKLPPCGNKECKNAPIDEGICTGCGKIISESNIVSEITFGESSSGAAVVQGAFLSHDQGAARGMGPAFRGGGQENNRAATIAEGKRQILAAGNVYNIKSTTTLDVAVETFKYVAGENFIQGRRLDMVAMVCLYNTVRKYGGCNLMLIDLADRIQVNVFKLGHTFRQMHIAFPYLSKGLRPILPEDLIWRFAAKLEFGVQTDKVGEDAIRLSQRMGLDWMTVGRRPAGVVGACLILAARMNNFRRTVTEVVYVVKVTVATIQKRLSEFKVSPSSVMSVEDFLSTGFLEQTMDPPAFTKHSETAKAKKRKRSGHDGDEVTEESLSSENNTEANKRQRTAQQGSDQLAPSVDQPRIDADGYTIPPLPMAPRQANSSEQADEVVIDPSLVDEVDAAMEKATGTDFSTLITEFGDVTASGSQGEDEDETEVDGEPATTAPKRRGRPAARDIYVPPEWEQSERELEGHIREIVADPSTSQHAKAYAHAKSKAAQIIMLLNLDNTQTQVSMDVHVGEDEFADDPEVQNCLLSPEDAAKKEKVWVNENKTWLRQQQLRMWEAKQQEGKPPKVKRVRKQKPRIGEGQTSAASTPAEAAKNALKARSLSKRINYAALDDVFKEVEFLKGANLGSASASRATSRAGSEYPESDAGSVAQSEHSIINIPPARNKRKAVRMIDDEEIGDADDYIEPEVGPVATPGADKEATAAAEEEEEEEYEEEYDEGNGDVLLDDEDGAFADRDFGNDDDFPGDDDY